MKAFFQELRRRKVTKVAAIYAIVAWALIESSSVIFPALHLPEWTVTFIVVLALLGFPVALTFSWVYDWTREGIVRTPGRDELPPEQVETLKRGRAIDFVIIAALLAVVAWLGWERVFDRTVEPEVAALDSIAVLPFVNMSGDPENEYFGDGLAEELLNALVQIEGLRVAARTSSFEYKGQHLDVRRIGEALGVATVLEGSVRKAGGRVRVTAQLIRADDGFHLWSDTYDRNLEDIFAVQDDISLAIVDALKVRLGSRERERVTARHTTDVEAFEAYLRGRFEMHRRTASSLARATEYFEQAIARDQDYAAAYSGLSDTWVLLSSYGAVTTEEAIREAEPLARRALELDPDLAEAQASWGLLLRQKHQYEESVAPFLRAIALNPSYSPAYHWLGLSYQALDRYHEAVELLQKAVEVDPQYLTGKRALLTSLRNIGADAEADALARRIAREHANDPMAFYGLSGDAQMQGRRVGAIRYLARGVGLAPDNTQLRQILAYALLNVGDIERADEQVEIIRQLDPAHQVLDFWHVELAFSEGRPDAFELAGELVDGMEPGEFRDRLACNLLVIAGRAGDAREACLRLLEGQGWKPGEPIPPGFSELVGNLVLAAKESGDMELAGTMFDTFEAQVDRMEAGGMNAGEIAWNRALIAAHRDGETEPLLELMPAQLGKGFWNPVYLHQAPLFKPVADDPRFPAIVEAHRAELARVREAARDIEIPGY